MSTWKSTIRKVLLFTMVEMTLKMISLMKKNQNLPNQKRQSNQVQNQQQGPEMTRRAPVRRQKGNKLLKL